MTSSEARKHLAMQLATGFAADCLQYLEAVEESLQRTSGKISFGTRVSVWRNDDGIIQGRLSSQPPKIPVAKRPPIDFVLRSVDEGQLELLHEGPPRTVEIKESNDG